MKALGTNGEEAIERGRQHVLTRVLLHVVEATSPVDCAVHGCANGELAIDDVGDVCLPGR